MDPMRGTHIALQVLIEWGSRAASAAVVVLLFQPDLLRTAWPWQLAAFSFARGGNGNGEETPLIALIVDI